MPDTKLSTGQPRATIGAGVKLVSLMDNGGGSFANETIDQTVLAEFIRDTMATALVQGSNLTITVDDAGNTITLAATGGGGSVALSAPGYKSGSRYRAGPYQTTNTAMTNNLMAFYPLVIREDVTVDALHLYSVTGVASSTVLVGVYAHDAATNRPAALLWAAASAFDLSSSAAGVARAPAGGNKVLVAGLYWIGVLCSGTATVVSTSTVDPWLSAMLGSPSSDTNPMAAKSALVHTTYGYSNGLPSTFVGLTGFSENVTAVPLVAFSKA